MADPIQFYTPDNYRAFESVGYMIRNAHISINKMVDVEMQKYDLTAMQWRPLLLIYFGLVKTAAGMAKESCMDTGATTRMLDRLQSKGLISRTRCGDDRRIMNLTLTEEGLQICEKIPADLCKAMNQHLARFTQHEVELLKGLLERMIANGLPQE